MLRPAGQQSSAATRSAYSPSDWWALVGSHVSAVAPGIGILGRRQAFVPGVVDVHRLQSGVARALPPQLAAFGRSQN